MYNASAFSQLHSNVLIRLEVVGRRSTTTEGAERPVASCAELDTYELRMFNKICEDQYCMCFLFYTSILQYLVGPDVYSQ